MAFQSNTFVYGETPSAAKWNQLWLNDDSLRDGTGLQINNDQAINWRNAADSDNLKGIEIGNDDILRLSQIEVQENTTDSTVEDVMIQTGWGYIDGAASASITKDVTLATAIDENETFSIIVQCLGLLVGAATKISDFATSNSLATARALVLSSGGNVTGFTVQMSNNDGSNFTTGRDYGFSWIVIGRKA